MNVQVATRSAVFQGLHRLLRPGDAIWWGQANTEPLTLTRTLVAHRHALAKGGRLRVFVGIGSTDTLRPEQSDAIDFFGYSAGGTHTVLAQAGLLDIVPSHYSHLPDLIREGRLPADVVFLQVSPPDAQGRYSLGLVNEYLIAALQSARAVIAEVHPDVPWTHGNLTLEADDFALLLESQYPLLEVERSEPGPVDAAIALHISQLVQDGATLQIGVGKIPDAVLSGLVDRKDLGLHTGAVSDNVVQLSEAGALTNARKGLDEGIAIGSILMGSARLRRWAHRNPQFAMRGTEYTHNPDVLAKLHQLVAINSAIEVDLTGQINAEVAGGAYLGAVGGAVDFLRGAARSHGGLPVVALPAKAKGASRIVAQLSGPVSTPRCDAGLIVTEHGVADLRGLTLARRVQCMLDIASPEHRADLERQAHKLLRYSGAAFSHTA